MVIQPKKRILLITSFLFKLDPTRQHLLLNDESIRACSQVLNGLSNLLYAFSRIANTCLLDNNNQQQNHFQTRLTLVHQ
jgi:hypothetical protein